MAYATNNSVLFNVDQNYPETSQNGASKQRARNNIGAASATDLTTETTRATAAEKAAKTEVAAGTGISVTSSTGANGQTIYTVGQNNIIQGSNVVLEQNGAGGIVTTPVNTLAIDTDFLSVSADGNEIGVIAPPPYTPYSDKVLGVSAGSDIPAWVDPLTIQTRSAPYSTANKITSLTIFDPGQNYGSVVSDQNSNNIGFLAPKHLGQQDLGKVLTIVSDNGYKMEWVDPTVGVPEITPMGQTTVYVSNSQPEYLTMEADTAYWIETMSGGSFTVHLGTLSTTTIHNKIYLVGTQANCVTMTIVYEDEGGQVQQLNYVYGDTQTDTVYALDIYSRKVTINSGNMSFDTTMCRVYDYPCQTRDYFSSDNNNIGLINNYVEPL